MPAAKGEEAVRGSTSLSDERRADVNKIYIENPCLSAAERKLKFAKEFGENLDSEDGKILLRGYNVRLKSSFHI